MPIIISLRTILLSIFNTISVDYRTLNHNILHEVEYENKKELKEVISTNIVKFLINRNLQDKLRGDLK